MAVRKEYAANFTLFSLKPFLYLTVTEALFSLFALCIFIQLLYIWFAFSRIGFAKKNSSEPIPESGLPPVSIVVAARNEYKNLLRLLPALMELDYPSYEVVIVNDRSYDETYDYLLEQKVKYKGRLKVVNVETTPDHINGKKYALTLGVKGAKYECLLFTDADCIPLSNQWVKKMIAPYLASDKTAVILGFSPYEKERSLLNLFIRYETFYVGVQYLSLGIMGYPFMGVGRNISYKKSLFLENKGFFKHKSVTGGDDDLFVNEVSTAQNTQVVWEADAQMLSIPEKSWGSWYRQKMRHLSVGQHYRSRNKTILGILSSSHLGLYALIVPLLLFLPQQQWWIPLAGYMLRLLSLLVVYIGARVRIDRNQPVWLVPFLDLLYIFYYIFVGISAVRRKRTSWN